MRALRHGWTPFPAMVLFSVLASLLYSTSVGAVDLICHSWRASAAADAAAEAQGRRNYAPSREVDYSHLALDITPDFTARTIAATAELRFKPIAKPLAELKLDAVELRVSEITSTETIRAWRNDDRQIVITFATPVEAGREAGVVIRYSAAPDQGLYFRTPEMGYRPGDTHLFTQGEAILARHWFPCFDAPNEKLTSEVICHVPEGMTVVANGRLASEVREPATGRVAFRWVQDKPHVTYLVALVAGYFKRLEEHHGEIPLTFYTPPSEFTNAASSFAGTRDMMEFFEKETGVPYPWAKYAQVCVDDFVAGGMENTSLTVLTDGTLFAPEAENLHDSEGLVAHELAHQWFGDLVTCKDWSHLWLNEGFATYYEALYRNHRHGRDAFLIDLWDMAESVLSQNPDNQPIVWRGYKHPDDQFNYLAYPKGGWVLHMLRSQLGDDLYRRCIHTHLERHAYGNVTTADLIAVIEELSGRSFDQFFDQWVYHAHHPELDVDYSWDETTRLAKIHVKQSQALSEQVLLFNFPLPVRFHLPTGAVDRVFTIKDKESDFYVPLPSAPSRVRIDPEFTVLARVRFTPNQEMLAGQLADAADPIGRLLAVRQLVGRDSAEAIGQLKKVLNEDPFYRIRSEAAQALRETHTDAALDALLASTNQPDSRVRLAVRSAVAGFYRESALASARAALATERNPEILRAALGNLGSAPGTQVRAELLGLLGRETYRNQLADGVIASLRTLGDPESVPPLLRVLREREASFTSWGYAGALGTLAYLARHDTNRDEVRAFLESKVNHPRRIVKTAAISALGELGDSKALGVLQTFATAAKESPERVAAEAAINALRAGRSSSEELGTLRTEVTALQKENRELRRSVEDLKQRFAEIASPTNTTARGTKAGKPGRRKNDK